MTHSTFRFGSDFQFLKAKTEGKNKKTKDSDIAISSSFFKGQINNYAFKIQKRFQCHISSCVDTLPSLEAAASTKGQKISEDLTELLLY